jgi:hypothetical protein
MGDGQDRLTNDAFILEDDTFGGSNTLRIAQMNVSLRPLEDRDLDTIYQQVSDPESVRMAAFTAEDQTDRRAFLNRMSRLRADPGVSH